MFSVGEFVVYGTTGVCLIEDGKKVITIDEKYLHMAEEKLYTELGLALGMTKEEVFGYIKQQVEKSEEMPVEPT